MARYRKRPVVVEAVQLRWATWNELCEFLGGIIGPHNPGRGCPASEAHDTCGEPGPDYLAIEIPTPEGKHVALHGDWIVRGSMGEFYPCAPDIFAATYELVDPNEEHLAAHPQLRTQPPFAEGVPVVLVDETGARHETKANAPWYAREATVIVGIEWQGLPIEVRNLPARLRAGDRFVIEFEPRVMSHR